MRRYLCAVAVVAAAWGCAGPGATRSPVETAASAPAGPVIVDAAAADELRRALGWTEHVVWARELPALPDVAPLSAIEREIAAQGGRTAVFYDGGGLVAHGVDHPPGPDLGRIVLNRFGDVLWLVPPVEHAAPDAHLVANPWVRWRLLRAQWDRFRKLLGFAARRGAPRVAVYTGRIPARDRAAIVARIRAQVAASRAGSRAAERGAGLAGHAAAGRVSVVLACTPRNLQKFFGKHGADFGLAGNWNPSRAADASRVIHQHINSPGVRTIRGAYRGKPAIHYVDPSTGLNVVADPEGNFVTGYRLGAEQLRDILTTGHLF